MRKVFSTIAVVAALFSGYSAYKTQSETKITEIALANIEALASNGEAPIYGVSTITGNCENQTVVSLLECSVYCTSCGSTWYPSPRVPHAKARNVSGSCACGYSNWSIYNL